MELDDAIDEDLRFQGSQVSLLFEREKIISHKYTEIESVGSDCELCVFCQSDLSKTFAIHTKGTNKQSINDVGGPRQYIQSLIHHCPLTLYTNTIKPRQKIPE